MIRVLGLLFLITLAGCDDDSPSDDARPDAAAAAADVGVPDAAPEPDVGPLPCTTTQLYDPSSSDAIDLFPDDLHTRDDPDSPTGLRLTADAPWVAAAPMLLIDAFADLEGLSGFGTNGAVVFRFDGALAAPPAPEASLESEAIWLLDLGVDPPARVPFRAALWDDDATLMLHPLRPLRPGTRHAALVTRAQLDAQGGCVDPSPTLAGLLAGEVDGALARMAPRYAELLDATGLHPDAVAAATVFTTHADHEPMFAVAAHVRAQRLAWEGPFDCVEGDGYRRCEGAFSARDYRTGRAIIDAPVESAARWRVPVSAWLPLDAGPAPVLVFGHGINSTRGHAERLARRIAPHGFAVVAADALAHGEHPTAPEGDAPAASALAFLGLNLTEAQVDGMQLRGHFDQTTADRLQLVELLHQAPDVDGDGEPDLDIERVGYFGISLGGMLGSALMALDERLQVGVFSVAGGGLMRFVTDTGQVAPLKPLLFNLAGSEDRLERLLAVMQTLVDAADPSTWAAELRDGQAHLLLPVALTDDTVPPAAGRALARALELPHLRPVAEPVWPLDEADAPLEGNVRGATRAYFQFDRVSAGEGVEVATHDNTPLGPEGFAQALRFLRDWADGEMPVVVDPYAELGTPPLE